MADTFAAIVRMMWVDDFIAEEGQINRDDITRAFAMSKAQASLDIKRYMNANPHRIAYDVRAKTYVKIEGSKPLFWRGARCAAAEMVQQVGKALSADVLMEMANG